MSSAEFDGERARRLGADAFGMRSFVVALLRKGPNRDQDEQTADALQRAHLDNIHRLTETGKLVLVGPFLDDGDLRGLFVFDVQSVAEARALTETDPAIAAGRLKMDLHPWYGSAALLDLSAIHRTIAQKSP